MISGYQVSLGAENRRLVWLSPSSGGHRQRHESTLRLRSARRWESVAARGVGNIGWLRAGASVVDIQKVNAR